MTRFVFALMKSEQSNFKTIMFVATALLMANLTFVSTTTNMMHNVYGSVYINGLPRKAPIVSSGNNAYVVWTSHPDNTTGATDQIMFRASHNGGTTFGNKINLSNSSKFQSHEVEIDASGNRVFVTWWESNQTVDIPVMRISSDKGDTFGPLMKLATNGTIGVQAEK